MTDIKLSISPKEKKNTTLKKIKNEKALVSENPIQAQKQEAFEKQVQVLIKTIQKMEQTLNGAYALFTDAVQTLKNVKTCVSNAEECLIMVHLAIRQNEYLQAWIPHENKD